MFTSYGETSGFSPVCGGELDYVNGGKGSSGGGSSSPKTYAIIAGTPQQDGSSPIIDLENPGVSYKNGNTTVNATVHLDYSKCLIPSATSVIISASRGISK